MNFSLEQLEGKFDGESDRACVALGVAELNVQLGLLFQRSFLGDQHQMLAPDGALGAFSTRIQLAHALRWIDDDVRDDLHRVLNIHADAGCRLGRSPFFDCIAADRCGALRVAARLLGDGLADGLGVHDGISPAMPPVAETAAQAARHRFEVTVQLLSRHIGALNVAAL